MDEVFEANITKATVGLSNTDVDTINLENKRTGQEKKESRAVLQELKTVLVSKQKEWKVREAKALARQHGTAYSEPEPVLASDGETGSVQSGRYSLGCSGQGSPALSSGGFLL